MWDSRSVRLSGSATRKVILWLLTTVPWWLQLRLLVVVTWWQSNIFFMSSYVELSRASTAALVSSKATEMSWLFTNWFSICIATVGVEYSWCSSNRRMWLPKADDSEAHPSVVQSRPVDNNCSMAIIQQLCGRWLWVCSKCLLPFPIVNKCTMCECLSGGWVGRRPDPPLWVHPGRRAGCLVHRWSGHCGQRRPEWNTY